MCAHRQTQSDQTYRPFMHLQIEKHVTHAIGRGSALNLRIGELCSGRTLACLESSVRALYAV